MQEVFVVTWKWSDGSNSGSVAVFSCPDRANDLLDKLKLHGDADKLFDIEKRYLE